jgi:hypothetical protein
MKTFLSILITIAIIPTLTNAMTITPNSPACDKGGEQLIFINCSETQHTLFYRPNLEFYGDDDTDCISLGFGTMQLLTGEGYGIYKILLIDDTNYLDCQTAGNDYSICQGLAEEIENFDWRQTGNCASILTLGNSSDLFSSVGTLVTDLWVLIAVAIGVPLAFYIIRQVIGLVPKSRGRSV